MSNESEVCYLSPKWHQVASGSITLVLGLNMETWCAAFAAAPINCPKSVKSN